MGSNEIKFIISQDTTTECINGSIGSKLREFLFPRTDPLKGIICERVFWRPESKILPVKKIKVYVLVPIVNKLQIIVEILRSPNLQ